MSTSFDQFLSCDWGTSALRLHLVDAQSGKSLASVASSDGISATYQAWQRAGAGVAREEFFLRVVRTQLERLAAAAGRPVDQLPLVMSGMVTSSIGLREIPHKDMPFALDGSDLRVERLEDVGAGSGPVLLVSGARTPADIMRGEEIQVVGAVALGAPRDALLVLPGTHSKHVRIERDRAIGLRTFMTGEVFELLATRSILANSIEEDAAGDTAEAAVAFAEGVAAGATVNLLHASFGVRVAELSQRRSRTEGYHYLSGLLIGAELRELQAHATRPVALVGSPALTTRYATALRALGHTGAINTFAAVATVIAGHRLVVVRAGLLG